MILSSSTSGQLQQQQPQLTQQVETIVGIPTNNREQPYQHKLNQMSLRTTSNKEQQASEQVSPEDGTECNKQEVGEGRRRRSRADSSRLSVILPQNQIIEHQQLGSSLQTPIAIHTNNSQANLIEAAYHQPPSSGCQLYNSLLQLAGQDRVGSFTGLPSCTPTSADALAASANLQPINPFFYNVDTYNKLNCDNNYAMQQQQQNNEPQSLPEDLSPRTKARLASSNSGSSNGQEQLQIPPGTLMLSPFPFLLSPQQEAWIRLTQLQGQSQHPPAGKSVPMFEDASTYHALRQQQQQKSSIGNQQYPSDIETASKPQAPSEESSSNLAQDLSNQQQTTDQQQQLPIKAPTAIATRFEPTVASNPQIISPSLSLSSSSSVTVSAASNHQTIGRVDQEAPTTIAPVCSLVQYHPPSSVHNHRLTNNCPTYLAHQEPYSNTNQPMSSAQVKMQPSELAQKQIFIPVHQQQPIAQSQPVQPFQPPPLSARDAILTETPSKEHIYLYGAPLTGHHSYPQPVRYDLQQAAGQQCSIVDPSSDCNSGQQLHLDSRMMSSHLPDEKSKRVDQSSTNVGTGSSSNSNSSSGFNCSSPNTLSTGSNSTTGSTRSSVSGDTSTSIDVVMATTNTKPASEKRMPIIRNTTSDTNQQTGPKLAKSEVKLTPKGKNKTSSELNNHRKEADSSNGIVASEPPVKKKSRGGRKKKQVSHDELMARKNRSKERNRVAAKRCRQKRKQFIDDLCAKIDNLNDLNRKLQKENAQLAAELDRLKSEQQDRS